MIESEVRQIVREEIKAERLDRTEAARSSLNEAITAAIKTEMERQRGSQGLLSP